MAHYRWQLVETDCLYGCPIGSLALELHEPDPVVRELLAANFANWTTAVAARFTEAGARLPARPRPPRVRRVHDDRDGRGVMQARTYRDVGYFDRKIAMVRRPRRHADGAREDGGVTRASATPAAPRVCCEPATIVSPGQRRLPVPDAVVQTSALLITR